MKLYLRSVLIFVITRLISSSPLNQQDFWDQENTDLPSCSLPIPWILFFTIRTILPAEVFTQWFKKLAVTVSRNTFFYVEILISSHLLREIQMKCMRLKSIIRASLVVQWLRICLPMQGTRVRALVWEDPACRRATGLVSHNY